MPTNTVTTNTDPISIEAHVEVTIDLADAQLVADPGALVAQVSERLAAVADVIIEAAVRPGGSVSVSDGFTSTQTSSASVVKVDPSDPPTE